MAHSYYGNSLDALMMHIAELMSHADDSEISAAKDGQPYSKILMLPSLCKTLVLAPSCVLY
jgi:hypothetical protein